MRLSVILSERAKTDLKEIYRYIAVDLQAVSDAVRQLSRIETEIMALQEMPERYQRYDCGRWRETNLRKMPVGKYLVFYTVSAEEKTVSVLRVLYGGRNIDDQLPDEKRQ